MSRSIVRRWPKNSASASSDSCPFVRHSRELNIGSFNNQSHKDGCEIRRRRRRTNSIVPSRRARVASPPTRQTDLHRFPFRIQCNITSKNMRIIISPFWQGTSPIPSAATMASYTARCTLSYEYSKTKSVRQKPQSLVRIIQKKKSHHRQLSIEYDFATAARRRRRRLGVAQSATVRGASDRRRCRRRRCVIGCERGELTFEMALRSDAHAGDATHQLDQYLCVCVCEGLLSLSLRSISSTTTSK